MGVRTISSYISEVLGVTYYLCPESVYALRSLEEGLPCKVLTVVFKKPSSSQKVLLKKIMASINVFEFSILEIKNDRVLDQLLSLRENLAGCICFFGIPDSFKKKFFNDKELRFVLQLCPLEELEGSSQEVRHRKKQVWEQLKKWRET